MRETLEQLLEVQEMTQKRTQLERDTEMLDVDVRNASRELKEKHRQREQAHQQRIEAAKDADALQLKIEEAEAEIQKLKVQQNSIRNEKEYKAVRHMIGAHEADIERWEDGALELLSTIDELAEREERLEQETQQAKADLERVEGEVRQKRVELLDRIEMLKHKIETLRRQIDPEILAVYDRLAAGRRSDPLAKVCNRTCLGCHTRITKQTENLLMRDDKMVYCHSCGRLLTLADY